MGKKDIERKIAKTVVYGVIYGRTEYSLAESFHMSLTEAEKSRAIEIAKTEPKIQEMLCCSELVKVDCFKLVVEIVMVARC